MTLIAVCFKCSLILSPRSYPSKAILKLGVLMALKTSEVFSELLVKEKKQANGPCNENLQNLQYMQTDKTHDCHRDTIRIFPSSEKVESCVFFICAYNWIDAYVFFAKYEFMRLCAHASKSLLSIPGPSPYTKPWRLKYASTHDPSH